MDVLIARGQVDLGTFPRERLPELARKGEIKPTDIYFHDGMDSWKPLAELLEPSAWEGGNDDMALRASPSPAKQPEATSAPVAAAMKRALRREAALWGALAGWRKIAAICVGAILAVLILGFFLVRGDSEPIEAGSMKTLGGSPTPAAELSEIREKAASDLRQRIARLPERAAPPLNTYYYDVSIEVKEAYGARTPLTAVIRGRENVLKPDSEEILSQTEFVVTADYTAGEWIYKAYRGTTLNTGSEAPTVLRHDQTRLTPPVLIGILGLKTVARTR